MQNTSPSQENNATNNPTKQKDPKRTKIIILCGEILLAVILIVAIVIVSLRPASNDISSTSDTEATEIIIDENNPACTLKKATAEPFASFSLDYPYAGVYEADSGYLCNTDLGYAVKIPENASKVFYILVNGGDVIIVGLEVDGQIMATPLSQETFSIINAGMITSVTEEVWEEFKNSLGQEADSYTLVLSGTTNRILESAQDDEEINALVEALYGGSADDINLVILYAKAVDPVIYESAEYEGLFSEELFAKVKEAYAQRNQQLNDLVDKIFGNPDNYYRLQPTETED